MELDCRIASGFLAPHPVQGPQVDQDVDERVLIDDGLAVAQPGALNTKRLGLGVDAFGGGPLFVNILVDLAIAVELVSVAVTAGGARSARH